MQINPDNKFLSAMSKMWDAIITTLYFTICCVPIFTIGAAITAMISTMMAIVQDSCTGITNHYFNAFRRDFRLSTLVWLIILIAGLLLSADIWVCWFWMGTGGLFLDVMKGITAFLTTSFCIAIAYAFFCIAKYVVTFSQVFRNALVLAVQNPFRTIVQIALLMLIALSSYLANILAFPIWVLLLYLMAINYVDIFLRTTPEVENNV